MLPQSQLRCWTWSSGEHVAASMPADIFVSPQKRQSQHESRLNTPSAKALEGVSGASNTKSGTGQTLLSVVFWSVSIISTRVCLMSTVHPSAVVIDRHVSVYFGAFPAWFVCATESMSHQKPFGSLPHAMWFPAGVEMGRWRRDRCMSFV